MARQTYVHIMEAVIDFVKLTVMSDILIDLDLAVQIICGRRRAMTLGTAKGEGDKPSTRPGISVLPLTPPKAEPRHTRPVTYAIDSDTPMCYDHPLTNWNLEIPPSYH